MQTWWLIEKRDQTEGCFVLADTGKEWVDVNVSEVYPDDDGLMKYENKEQAEWDMDVLEIPHDKYHAVEHQWV